VLRVVDIARRPAADGAGEIVGLGDGVPAGRMGERVWLWNAQGGYGGPGRAFGSAAELIALPQGQAVALPDALSFEAGACLGIPAMTGHRAVFADGPVADQTILIAGAGGAVAHLAVQFAVDGGARVIGTAGNPDRAAHARAAALGPDKTPSAPDYTHMNSDYGFAHFEAFARQWLGLEPECRTHSPRKEYDHGLGP